MTMNDLRKLCRKLQVEQHETTEIKKKKEKQRKKEIYVCLY